MHHLALWCVFDMAVHMYLLLIAAFMHPPLFAMPDIANDRFDQCQPQQATELHDIELKLLEILARFLGCFLFCMIELVLPLGFSHASVAGIAYIFLPR